jgi:hypothetical protein
MRSTPDCKHILCLMITYFDNSYKQAPRCDTRPGKNMRIDLHQYKIDE